MAKRMKKWIVGTMACALLAATPAFAAPTEVFLNGDLLETQDEVRIQDGRTLMGFRDFFSATGLAVNWDDDTRTATTEAEGLAIVIRPDSGEVLVNNDAQELDVPPQLLDGHIYLPLRFFSESLGYEVDFTQEDERNIVTLEKDIAPAERPAEQRLTNANNGNADMGYFIVDNRLVALSWHNGQLRLERLNMDDGSIVQTQRFFVGGKESGIADVFETPAGEAALTFYAPDMGDFVGSSVPRLKQPLTMLETSLGELPLYETPAASAPLVIQARGISAEILDNTGYAIDTAGLPAGARAAVDLSRDKILYLINDKLLLVDPKAVNPLLLDADTAASQLIADGDRAVAAGVKNGVLHIDLIAADGEQRSTEPAMNAGDTLAIRDMKRTETGVFILLEDGKNSFVVKIAADNDVTVRTIDGLFDRFIPNLDDGSLRGLRIDQNGDYVLSKITLAAGLPRDTADDTPATAMN